MPFDPIGLAAQGFIFGTATPIPGDELIYAGVGFATGLLIKSINQHEGERLNRVNSMIERDRAAFKQVVFHNNVMSQLKANWNVGDYDGIIFQPILSGGAEESSLNAIIAHTSEQVDVSILSQQGSNLFTQNNCPVRMCFDPFTNLNNDFSVSKQLGFAMSALALIQFFQASDFKLRLLPEGEA